VTTALASKPQESTRTDAASDIHKLELTIDELLVRLEHAETMLDIKVRENGEFSAQANRHRALIANLEAQIKGLQSALSEQKAAGALDQKTMASYQKSVTDYQKRVVKQEEKIARLGKRLKWSAGLGFVAGILVTIVLSR
jgi:chromosome segregation ATPase